MYNSNKKFISLLFISFVITYSFIFMVIYIDKSKRIEYALEEEIKNLKTHYSLTKKQFDVDIKNGYNNIQNNKKAMKIFEKAYTLSGDKRDILRKQFQDILSGHYTQLKNRGVLQFQFVFPNNISFLRMHKPSKYGDNLSDVRYSFKYVNETKKSISGFEQGRTSHGFRYVAPLFSNKKYLGSVEISFGSEILQDNLQSSSEIHSHFLINKDIFKVKAWKRDDLKYKYIPSIENKNYLFTTSKVINHKELENSKENIILLKKDIIKNMDLKKPFGIYVKSKNKLNVLAFLPIKNIKEKKIVAYLVSYTNNQNIENILFDFKLINMVIFFSLSLLFIFIYKTRMHKIVLEQEVKKQLNEIREKDIILVQQSKMAAMGEMIGNIAHQWRQPLNILGIKNMTLNMYYKKGLVTDEFVKEHISTTSDTLQYMSNTIDDFKDFFKPNKEKIKFNIYEVIIKSVDVVKDSLIKQNILCTINNENNIIINGYKNEFAQVILNLITNAKDALIINHIKHGYIVIDIIQSKDIIIIAVKDNAGGVPNDIINKVFEPYFTTKHKSQGIGIGLYMSKMIIENHMDGNLSVSNDKDGAVFTIELKKAKVIDVIK